MVAHQILRRAIEGCNEGIKHGLKATTAVSQQQQQDDGNNEDKPVNPVALLVIALTMMAFFVSLFCISYTYGHLIPTLCMVESPETTAYVPVDSMDRSDPPAYDESTPKPIDEEDILLVQNKPVTSSLRATILHLRARAGYWSRFRGLSLFLVWNVLTGIIISALSSASHNRLMLGVASIVAETILARYHMTWIHIVISEPSPKRWYKRVPPFKTYTKIAPAVALWALSAQVVAILPMLVCGSFGSLKHMKNPEYQPDKKDLYAVGAQGFFGMFLMLTLFVLLQVPATVTMVRVAASMLPEEDESIVPFDRTFDGQTRAEIVGGQGKVGLVEAWRSFPRASRVRLMKTIAKVALIVMAVWVAAIVTVTAESHVMLGDNVGHVMKAIHGVAGPQ